MMECVRVSGKNIKVDRERDNAQQRIEKNAYRFLLV